jgi:hypothetical protein
MVLGRQINRGQTESQGQFLFNILSIMRILLCKTSQAKNLHLDSVLADQMCLAGKGIVAPKN